jgi:hypothetical protein
MLATDRKEHAPSNYEYSKIIPSSNSPIYNRKSVLSLPISETSSSCSPVFPPLEDLTDFDDFENSILNLSSESAPILTPQQSTVLTEWLENVRLVVEVYHRPSLSSTNMEADLTKLDTDDVRIGTATIDLRPLLLPSFKFILGW